jgi:hypothetical protein
MNEHRIYWPSNSINTSFARARDIRKCPARLKSTGPCVDPGLHVAEERYQALYPSCVKTRTLPIEGDKFLRVDYLGIVALAFWLY